MDHLRRQRRGAATGDPELGAAPTEPDYATALSPEGSLPAGESRYGEASPSTLEQGGAFVPEPVAAAEMIGPVASPFHSERVKQEVALARSRPRTLDEDARRMGEVNDTGLGDANLSGRNDEPMYFEDGSAQSSPPRVARIERAVDVKTEVQDPGQAVVAEDSLSRGSTQLRRSVDDQGSVGLGLVSESAGEERASSSANKLTSAVQSPDKPLPEDPRELVPAASEGSRVEAMLLQVIEENRLLRSRLDQVERSSWHSGGTRNTGELPVGSPVSFAPPSDFPVGAEYLRQGPSVLERFVREGDLQAQMNLEVARFRDGYSPQLDPRSGSRMVGFPGQGPMIGTDGFGKGLGVPGLGFDGSAGTRVDEQPPVQNFREFRRLMEIEGMRQPVDTGYHTPRSGVGGGARVSSDGYPMSPGGTIIRPPPIPPPASPRAPPVAPVAVAPIVPPVLPSPYLPQEPRGFCEGGGFSPGVRNPEEPAKYIMELPKLVQADLSVSAVTCGNWWAQVKQIFTGMSPGAPEWFSSVERAATRHYNQWLVADPLGRLSLDPGGVTADFDAYKFQRVESRAVSLLLAAIPQAIKDDLVTNRWLTRASILFRILCLYQPGGASERSHLLNQLVSPEVCKSYKEAISGLRRWSQNLSRAQEIHAALPDSSLLLRGIDQATTALLNQSPMISFRVSAFRHRTSLDYNPTITGVVQLVRLIQAECESASLVVEGGSDGNKRARAAAAQAAQGAQGAQGSQGSVVPPSASSAEAKGPGPTGGQALAAMVKAPGGEAQGGQSKGKGKGGASSGGDGPALCHNFSNAAGCRYGDSCRFKHDRVKARKDKRCLACGQSGHYRPECTVVPAELRQGPNDSNSESASPKSPEPKKPAAKPKPKAGPQAKGITEDSSGGAASTQGNGSGNSSAPAQQELLAEAQKLLKGISLKAIHVRDPLETHGIDRAWLLSAVVNASPTSASDMSYALVDSGATNGLREARPGEWDKTQAIKVDLASGVAELHVNSHGTLLSPTACQVIIPAGWLVELGFKISWKKRGCSIKHEEKGQLDVKVVKGCPLISREDGLRLLEEYEGLKGSDVEGSLRKVEGPVQNEELNPETARGWLREVLRNKGEQGPSKHEQDAFLRGMFPELPERLVSRVSVPAFDPEGFDYGPLPWNRRFRRSIRRAKPGSVMVHLFAKTKCWKGFGSVIEIGKTCQSDLLSRSVFQQVLRWASSGVVGGLVGALPRRDVEFGSRLLRQRFGGDRWGRPDLSGDERDQVDQETIQWFRFFLVFAVAQAVQDARSYGSEAFKWEPEDDPLEGVPRVKDPKELAVWALQKAAAKLKRANIERARSRSTVFLVAEYPRDPAEGLGIGVAELNGYPSLWAFPEVRDMVRTYGLHEASFDQGSLGSESQEPTSVATSSWFLFESLQGLYGGITGSGATGREWSPGLLRLVRAAWVGWLKGAESEAVVEARRVLLAKLSDAERKRLHEQNDHVPYMKGCPVCIQAQGRQRSHWRSSVTSLYSLSCDIAGPFRTGQGWDPIASGRDTSLN